ncbi:MAG TPA: hypothetical protein VGJ25_09060 [Gaiellaceae bacterium]
MSTLETKLRELDELVDGQETWSHRKRLHELENTDRGVELAKQVLERARNERDRRFGSLREWGILAVAVAAILVNRLF